MRKKVSPSRSVNGVSRVPCSQCKEVHHLPGPFGKGRVCCAPAEPLDRDRLISAIATEQFGLITVGQLHAVGVPPHTASRWASRGRLIRLHRGVYLVGHASRTRRTELLAATFAAGPDSLLARHSAAELARMLDPASGTEPNLLVAKGYTPRIQGLRIKRATTLHPSDIWRPHGIPATRPALTILDLAATDPSLAEQALDRARNDREIPTPNFDPLRARYPARAGWPALRALLDIGPEAGFSRSRAERLLLRLIRDAGFPEPLRNKTASGYEVDFHWPSHRLVVEFDSWEHHRDRASFDRDREKWAELQDQGWTVIPITWKALTRRPEWVVAKIAAALARGATGTRAGIR